MCMLTDLDSFYLAAKRQSNKSHIQNLMAGIYYHLLYFFGQLIFKSDSDAIDELLFPRVKNLKLKRNEAFSAEIILYFIREKGNYFFFFLIQSVQEALDSATERDL